MNGHAPYWPATGSQVLVTRKDRPNLARDAPELMYSSNTSSPVTSRMLAAAAKVIRYATSSPARRRCTNDRAGLAGPALVIVVEEAAIRHARSLDLRDRFLLLGHDRLGQARVGQRLGHILAIREHPGQEILDRFFLGGVADFFRNQQPREARNRVGVLTGRVGDGDTEIVRHLLGGAGGRGRHAGQTGFDESAGNVLHLAVRDLVLDGVDQLD